MTPVRIMRSNADSFSSAKTGKDKVIRINVKISFFISEPHKAWRPGNSLRKYPYAYPEPCLRTRHIKAEAGPYRTSLSTDLLRGEGPGNSQKRAPAYPVSRA